MFHTSSFAFFALNLFHLFTWPLPFLFLVWHEDQYIQVVVLASNTLRPATNVNRSWPQTKATPPNTRTHRPAKVPLLSPIRTDCVSCQLWALNGLTLIGLMAPRIVNLKKTSPSPRKFVTIWIKRRIWCEFVVKGKFSVCNFWLLVRFLYKS